MTEDAEKIVEAINNLKGSVDGYKDLQKRIESIEDRMHDTETKMIQYNCFVDKTSGFFTRVGFYGDAAVIWLRMKFKGGK